MNFCKLQTRKDRLTCELISDEFSLKSNDLEKSYRVSRRKYWRDTRGTACRA